MIKEVEYKNYGKCIEISNGIVDLLITTEVGPRIIRYGFVGERNEFCDDAPLTLDVDGEDWRLMGGHRFWMSPKNTQGHISLIMILLNIERLIPG